MTAIAYPLTTGVRHSFPDIEAKIAGQIFIGIKSGEYSRTRSRTMLYGTNVDPIGKTRGKNEYKGSVEIYLAEFDFLLSLLAEQAGGLGGYGDQAFNVTFTYITPGFDPIIDTLIGCTLDTTDVSNSEGTEGLTRKFELNPVKILFNGQEDSAVPLVAPPGGA